MRLTVQVKYDKKKKGARQHNISFTLFSFILWIGFELRNDLLKAFSPLTALCSLKLLFNLVQWCRYHRQQQPRLHFTLAQSHFSLKSRSTKNENRLFIHYTHIHTHTVGREKNNEMKMFRSFSIGERREKEYKNSHFFFNQRSKWKI